MPIILYRSNVLAALCAKCTLHLIENMFCYDEVTLIIFILINLLETCIYTNVAYAGF